MLKIGIAILELVFGWRLKFFQLLYDRVTNVKIRDIPVTYMETAIAIVNDTNYVCHVLIDPAYLHSKGQSLNDITVVVCSVFPEENIYIIRISPSVKLLSEAHRCAIYAHEFAHILYGHKYIPVYQIDDVLTYDLIQFYRWLWSLLITNKTDAYLEQEKLADTEAIRVTSRWTVLSLLWKSALRKDIATKILTFRRMWYVLWCTPSKNSYNWRITTCILKTSIE